MNGPWGTFPLVADPVIEKELLRIISHLSDGRHGGIRISAITRINRFVKQQGAVPGIQIAHAGRKPSASRRWDGDQHLPDDQGGWPIIAPSAVAFGGGLTTMPRAMTEADIARVQNDFVAATKRSLTAGVEWLELH